MVNPRHQPGILPSTTAVSIVSHDQLWTALSLALPDRFSLCGREKKNVKKRSGNARLLDCSGDRVFTVDLLWILFHGLFRLPPRPPARAPTHSAHPLSYTGPKLVRTFKKRSEMASNQAAS